MDKMDRLIGKRMALKRLDASTETLPPADAFRKIIDVRHGIDIAGYICILGPRYIEGVITDHRNILSFLPYNYNQVDEYVNYKDGKYIDLVICEAWTK